MTIPQPPKQKAQTAVDIFQSVMSPESYQELQKIFKGNAVPLAEAIMHLIKINNIALSKARSIEEVKFLQGKIEAYKNLIDNFLCAFVERFGDAATVKKIKQRYEQEFLSVVGGEKK